MHLFFHNILFLNRKQVWPSKKKRARIVKEVGNEKKTKLVNKKNRAKCTDPPNSRSDTVLSRLSPLASVEGRRDLLPLNARLSPMVECDIDIANIFALLC
jgi:hypothetical protein